MSLNPPQDPLAALAKGVRVPVGNADALRLGEATGDELRALLPRLMEAARSVRNRAWGTRVTFSPKVFLPITNLCKNRCSYCSFRKSPSEAGAWTLSPAEVEEWIARARDAGCAEALLCLGDKPEGVFPTYRAQLEAWRFDGTVDYLCTASAIALAHGLLPHTNAGILTREDMARLRTTNVSLGLMLESASARLCEPGMPHHAAPDKRHEVRIRMIEEAGELAIPFTTGILIGIGETQRERIEALLVIRDLHRKHGHIQEVIVQNFRAVGAGNARVPMHGAPEPGDDEIAHTVAMARLILDPEVSVQAPPNLNAAGAAMLLDAGINDFGGISPVSPDYINPRHPWPHLDALAEVCASRGFTLAPRAPIYDRFADSPRFLDPGLAPQTTRVRARLARVTHPSELAPKRSSKAPEQMEEAR